LRRPTFLEAIFGLTQLLDTLISQHQPTFKLQHYLFAVITMDSKRRENQKLHEQMVLTISKLFPNISLNVVISAVKKSNLNLALAVQYVTESDEFQHSQPQTLCEYKETEDKASFCLDTKQQQASGCDAKDLTSISKPIPQPVKSEEKRKLKYSTSYADKITQVQEIFPDIDAELIALQLEKCEGDVEKCVLCLLDQKTPNPSCRKFAASPSHRRSSNPSLQTNKNSNVFADIDSDDEIWGVDSEESLVYDPYNDVEAWFFHLEDKRKPKKPQVTNAKLKIYQQIIDEHNAKECERQKLKDISSSERRHVEGHQSLQKERQKRYECDYQGTLPASAESPHDQKTKTEELALSTHPQRKIPRPYSLFDILKTQIDAVLLPIQNTLTAKITNSETNNSNNNVTNNSEIIGDSEFIEAELSKTQSQVHWLPTREYISKQQTELRTLKTKLLDAVKISDSRPFVVNVTLQEPLEKGSDGRRLFSQPLHLFLVVIIPPKYPDQIPRLTVLSNRIHCPLPVETIQRLEARLRHKARSLRGRVMIEKLVEEAEEWLQNSETVRIHAKKASLTEEKGVTQGDIAASLRHILSHKVSYSCVDSDDILRLRNRTIAKAEKLLSNTKTKQFLTSATIRTMLMYFQWDLKKFVETYLNAEDENSVEELFQEVGIPFIKRTHAINNEEIVKSYEMKHKCPACEEEYDLDRIIELTCGHFYCFECYREYLKIKITEGNAERITCPRFNCKYILGQTFVSAIIDGDLYRQYIYYIAKGFAENNPAVKWCPAPHCELALINPKREFMVMCYCGAVWCFVCGSEFHWPATCEELKWWNEPHNLDDDARNDNASLDWFLKHTQMCPKCHTSIEKNGGCNHMSCTKCQFDFCWICLSPWSVEHYLCETVAPASDSEAVPILKDKVRVVIETSFKTLWQLHENERQKADAIIKKTLLDQLGKWLASGQTNVSDCQTLCTAMEFIILVFN
jgi:hypothetical protein